MPSEPCIRNDLGCQPYIQIRICVQNVHPKWSQAANRIRDDFGPMPAMEGCTIVHNDMEFVIHCVR